MKFSDMLSKIRNDFLKHNFETYRFFKATNHDFVFWNNEVKHVPDSLKRNVPQMICFVPDLDLELKFYSATIGR